MFIAEEPGNWINDELDGLSISTLSSPMSTMPSYQPSTSDSVGYPFPGSVILLAEDNHVGIVYQNIYACPCAPYLTFLALGCQTIYQEYHRAARGRNRGG